ncbi:MAG: amidohydrolase family protein [Planctomycetota bacterium]
MVPHNANADAYWVKCQGFFSDGAIRSKAWLRCEDGVIVGIESHAPQDSAPTVAPTGYLVPLLADPHVHFYMDPWPIDPGQRSVPGDQGLDLETGDAIQRVRHALAAGIGLLRDLGDPLGVNVAVKRYFAERSEAAPELQVVGTGIHRPKKYGRYLGVMRETLDEIKRTITHLIEEQQVDCIKLVTTGIVNFERKTVRQSPQFSIAELTELVTFAHAQGRPVAAHCSGQDGLEVAIHAGVDFIEHAYFMTDDQLARLTEEQLVWTPTFAPVYTQYAQPDCGWSEEVRGCIREILVDHTQLLATAHQRGTAVMAGTDAGCPGVEMGRGLRTELACMAEAGIPAVDLLQLATTGTAQLCGARTYTGRVEPGAPASFGLYTQPPWESIQHLETLSDVFHQGQRIESAISTN